MTSGPALSCGDLFTDTQVNNLLPAKFPQNITHKQTNKNDTIHTYNGIDSIFNSETRDGPRLDADGDADHHLHQGCRAADVGGDVDDNRHDHQRRNIVRLDDAIRACRRNLHSFQ